MAGRALAKWCVIAVTSSLLAHPRILLTLVSVYHDEVLNDLRRPKDQRKISQYSEEEEKDKKASGGRYAIPRGGLYELVSYPNYLSEW